MSRGLPDDPQRIFRLLVLYRWLSLVPPLLVVAWQGRVAPLPGAALLLAAGANAAITLFAGAINRFLRAHVMVLAADLLLLPAILQRFRV